MGGLSKKSYQIKALADKALPLAVHLDAGNLLFKQPTIAHSQELLTAAGLMEIYQQMAVDAVAVGPHDLAGGIDFLKNDQFKSFPWLSANLVDKHGNPLFSATKIVERGAMKIGIIGLTGPIAAPSPEIIVADWRKVLPEHLEQLAKECQLVVVLSSLSSEDNAELARQFPMLSVLITADKKQGNILPRVENNTLVTQTMSQGKYLGILNLDLTPGGSWSTDRGQEERIPSGKTQSQHLSTFNGNFIPLSKTLPEDPAITASVEVIQQRIAAHNQKSTNADNQQIADRDQSFSGMAGFARCRECHPLQAQFWSTTRHAGAYATLQRQRQNFNLDCLPCHISQNPDRDLTASTSIESLLTLPATLQTVGCEACHGAGRAHADQPNKAKTYRKVEEKICRACHTKERDPAFDYHEKSPQVSCPAG